MVGRYSDRSRTGCAVCGDTGRTGGSANHIIFYGHSSRTGGDAASDFFILAKSIELASPS